MGCTPFLEYTYFRSFEDGIFEILEIGSTLALGEGPGVIQKGPWEGLGRGMEDDRNL